MAWQVVYHPDAEVELAKVPDRERVAIIRAVEKLQALGPALGHPHSSDIRIADNLRELRPRAGNSPWRAFYRRLDSVFVIAAIGPEADVNPSRFKKAVRAAERRIDDLEED